MFAPLSAKQYREEVAMNAKLSREQQKQDLEEARKDELHAIKVAEAKAKANQALDQKNDTHKFKMKELGGPLSKKAPTMPEQSGGSPLQSVPNEASLTNPEAGPSDTVPAMLTPGEAVIPAPVAQDPQYQPLIASMVQEGRDRNGYADGTPSVMDRVKQYFTGSKSDAPPPPPKLGGQAGVAQEAISGRKQTIDDLERKSVGYAQGTKGVPRMAGMVQNDNMLAILPKVGARRKLKGYAEGTTEVPKLGGQAGEAQKALSGRQKQIDDAEKKALGYAEGTWEVPAPTRAQAGKIDGSSGVPIPYYTNAQQDDGYRQTLELKMKGMNPNSDEYKIYADELNRGSMPMPAPAVPLRTEKQAVASATTVTPEDQAFTNYMNADPAANEQRRLADIASLDREIARHKPGTEPYNVLMAEKAKLGSTGVPTESETMRAVKAPFRTIGDWIKNTYTGTNTGEPPKNSYFGGETDQMGNQSGFTNDVPLPGSIKEAVQSNPQGMKPLDVVPPLDNTVTNVDVAQQPSPIQQMTEAQGQQMLSDIGKANQGVIADAVNTAKETGDKSFLEKVIADVYSEKGENSIFNRQELLRFAMVAAGGMLTGGSTNGSLRFAAKDVLAHSDSRLSTQATVNNQMRVEDVKAKAEAAKTLNARYQTLRDHFTSSLDAPTVDATTKAKAIALSQQGTTPQEKLASLEAATRMMNMSKTPKEGKEKTPEVRIKAVQDDAEKRIKDALELELGQHTDNKGTVNKLYGNTRSVRTYADQIPGYMAKNGLDLDDEGTVQNFWPIVNNAAAKLGRDVKTGKSRVDDFVQYLDAERIRATVPEKFDPKAFTARGKEMSATRISDLNNHIRGMVEGKTPAERENNRVKKYETLYREFVSRKDKWEDTDDESAFSQFVKSKAKKKE